MLTLLEALSPTAASALQPTSAEPSITSVASTNNVFMANSLRPEGEWLDSLKRARSMPENARYCGTLTLLLVSLTLPSALQPTSAVPNTANITTANRIFITISFALRAEWLDSLQLAGHPPVWQG